MFTCYVYMLYYSPVFLFVKRGKAIFQEKVKGIGHASVFLFINKDVMQYSRHCRSRATPEYKYGSGCFRSFRDHPSARELP